MRFLVLLFAVFFVAMSPARADVVTWADPEFGITAAFPDRWELQSVEKPYQRLRLILDSSLAAECHIYTAPDGRYKVYPHRFYGDINALELDKDFWAGHLAESDAYALRALQDGSLGRGYSVYTIADSAHGGAILRSLLKGSIYGDKRVVGHCAAPHHLYAAYLPHFRAFLKSIDHKPEFHSHKTGYYRDFLNN